MPFWSGLFDRSHLVRAIVLSWLHYDWELRTLEERSASRTKAIQELIESGKELQDFGAAHHVKTLLLIHPNWDEVRQNKLAAELLEVERGVAAAHLEFADLLDDFVKTIPEPITPEYYWPIDAHYTHKGYDVFARAVEKALRKRNWI